ncbi:MAG: hypothetical protein J4452_02945 [Candidatus Aenigmarchaeota archaeon]|nr:hypothetical protein [Candidatus Aenigmarchaeota archaeon]
MTEFYLAASQNWIYLFLYPAVLWIILLVYRKSYKKVGEIKKQMVFGIVSVLLGSMGDFIGTNLNLWHFPDGDLPAIIVIVYFFVGMGAYNIVKLIDEKI